MIQDLAIVQEQNFPPLRKIRRLAALLLAALLLMLSGATQGAALPRDAGAYTFFAEKAPVTSVLADFCANFGLRLKMDPRIDDKLSGRLAGTSPSDFLNNVTGTLGLTWFYHQGTLYVASELSWQTKRFSVARDAIPPLKQALLDLGQLEPRFGWAAIPEQEVVMVSGPPDYVELLAATIQSLQLNPRGQQIRVFRLQHAFSDDRITNFRDQQIVVPGVASMLRSLVGGRAQEGRARKAAADAAQNAAPVGSPAVIGGEPPAGAKSAVPAPPRSPGATLASPADYGRDATIESDVRLNAVVIKDSPESLPMYQSLIEALDVAMAHIEIEAMTIDVSKTHVDDLGVDWAVGKNNTALGYDQSTSTISLAQRATLPAAGATAMTVVANQAISLVAKIRLLEQNGNAKVVGKPSVLTSDNLSAIIDLSQTFYVKVAGERVASLMPVTTGVMLKVTPHLISQAGEAAEIRLSIDIEDGTLVDRAGLDLPVVQKSTISTQATILENQSLLIGGYDTESDSDEVSRVPVLGALPWIGGIFSHTTVRKEKRKRLFLITPRIVRTGIATAASTHTPFPAIPNPPPSPTELAPAPSSLPLPSRESRTLDTPDKAASDHGTAMRKNSADRAPKPVIAPTDLQLALSTKLTINSAATQGGE